MLLDGRQKEDKDEKVATDLYLFYFYDIHSSICF